MQAVLVTLRCGQEIRGCGQVLRARKKTFLGMYEDQTQHYDPEIHEEYLIHMVHRTLPTATSCADV